MIFTVSRESKSYTIFYLLVIFFASVFVLCPIAGSCAEESLPAAKKITDSQKKAAGIGKSNADSDKSSSPEDTLYDYEKPSVEEESYTWLIFKTMIVLGGLVAGFYYFYRFVSKKAGIQSLGRDVIKILSIVPVGQNKFLQVVDLAGRIMVIGVSDSSINLITEIREKDEIDRIRLLSSKSSPVHPGGFQDYISKYISRLFRKDGSNNARGVRFQESESAEIDRMDYLKKQRERLKKINGKNNEI